jgi:hypothetical protein
MINARLAALVGMATLAIAGFSHAAGVPPSVTAARVPVEAPPPAARSEPAEPLHAYLLSAGQYVLDVGTLAQQRSGAPTVSAVPLPGALWLFATALLAFLGISGRRK